VSLPSSESVRELVSAFQFLRRLPERDRTALLGQATRVRYPSGSIVYKQGEAGGDLLLILSGRVHVMAVGGDGSEVLLNIIGPGEVVGEIAALDGGKRTANVVAVTEVEGVTLPGRALVAVGSGSAGAEALISLLCRRIRETTVVADAALRLDVPARLLERLRALAARGLVPWRGGVEIRHGLTQAELAASIGASRVSTNQTLATWRRLGLIEYGRGVIRISDVVQLEERVMKEGR
jgi:CRP-like cAMP-binding protein